ncbi:acrosomal protein SP-10-like isoform X1 [Eubalaena glacialis]|uniref:acrosomal protein SP-10-like isoform X1 n=1 Tax=Eubalaena glacialis TaxID=27606 RepID=UPI002A5A070F|nr:acrosomal protein SP-10-like isoform X1 [Eubalaena glacialis]
MKKFLLLVSLYLLGSARGASGQPVELPGSMDHQASVQQHSGDYFSLANPSDGEALYETSSGESTLSEHGSSEHTAVEHASVEQASSEHAAVEHASSEHAAGEHAPDEHASSEQPSGEQPSGEKPSGEQPTGEQPAGEQVASEEVASEKPSGEQPAGEQVSAEQVSGEKSPGEQPSGEQPSGIPPSSTISGPVLNCHTCSYMNDQGKCLRGEGVCSTQNSQQCMLKKIFEGGKLQFIVQGCENMCPSMNLFSHGTRMQIICCRNQPFCNKV